MNEFFVKTHSFIFYTENYKITMKTFLSRLPPPPFCRWHQTSLLLYMNWFSLVFFKRFTWNCFRWNILHLNVIEMRGRWKRHKLPKKVKRKGRWTRKYSVLRWVQYEILMTMTIKARKESDGRTEYRERWWLDDVFCRQQRKSREPDRLK